MKNTKRRRRIPAGEQILKSDIGNWIFLPEEVREVIEAANRILENKPGTLLGVNDQGDLLFEARAARFGSFFAIEGFTGYKGEERVLWRK